MISRFFIVLIFIILSGCSSPRNKNKNAHIYWHEDFYRGLNTNNLNLTNPTEVFDFVFVNLREEINIYPSENYYYFSFTSNGHLIRGSLNLHANSRDRGILEFAYYEVGATDPQTKYRHMLELNSKDGIQIKKISNVQYSVSYKGKKIVANLRSNNDVSLYNTQLLPEESIAFNSNDESGLDFQFIFNKENNHGYWILNDRTFQNETFEVIQKSLLVGNRTQFVFYQLEEQNKLILVGAYQNNVVRNEWYDGPFDQVADNAAKDKKIDLKALYLKIRPELKENSINELGFNTTREGRAAPMPYFIYSNFGELQAIVKDCEKKYQKRNAKFIRCITPAP